MTSKDIRKTARENLSGNWGLSVGVTLVAALLGGMVFGTASSVGGSGTNYRFTSEQFSALPGPIIALAASVLSVAALLGLVEFIIGGTVELGHAAYLLDQARGKKLTFSTLFGQFDRFGTGFVQAFLRGLYITLWSLLLVVPGIIKAYSYAMTPFILADHPEMTASQAITASKELMNGHKMDLFILELSFIGWQLLASLTMGIGFLFVNPYLNAAAAVFYQDISGHTQARDAYVPPVEF